MLYCELGDDLMDSELKSIIIEDYSFWSHVSLVESLLLEDNFYTPEKARRHWDNHVFSSAFGYDWRVKYKTRLEDGRVIQRYKFPYMTLEDYVKSANEFLNDTDVGTSDTKLNTGYSLGPSKIIGFETEGFDGAGNPNLPYYVKFRNSDKMVPITRGSTQLIKLPLIEYIEYQVKSNGERKIISYGIVNDSIAESFANLGELPESERSTYTVKQDYLDAKERDKNAKEKEKEREQDIQNEIVCCDFVDISSVVPEYSTYECVRKDAPNILEIKDNKIVYRIYHKENGKTIKSFLQPTFKDKVNKIEEEYNIELLNIGEKQPKQYVRLKSIISNLTSGTPSDIFIYSLIKIYTIKKLRGDGNVKVASNVRRVCEFNDGDITSPLEDFDLYKQLIESRLKLTESILQEANRQQLLAKSRGAQHYKDMSKGKNRYERRNKSRISATVRDYNQIDMDSLFKRDVLFFSIPVQGETDKYAVDIQVDGLLAEVQKQVVANKGKLEFKVILTSLMKVLNTGNIYVNCNCPDFKYRHGYHATKNGYKAKFKETRPSNKTNPNDTMGAGCKHIMLVLANLDWAVKISSVINNYIKYCQENLERNYADYIFPKVYGVKYQNAVQLNLFDNGLLPSDKATLDAVIAQGMRGKDEKGKFVKNNEFRFTKKPGGVTGPDDTEDNPLGLELQ